MGERLPAPITEIGDLQKDRIRSPGQNRASLYDEITEKVIAELAGRGPSVQP